MLDRIDAGVSFGDFSGGINEERVPRRELHQAEIGQRSVGVGDFVFGIGQQLEIQALFGAELLV